MRLGQVLVVLRVAAADVAARHHDLGAQGFEMKDFLAAHLVGDDQHQAVALCAATRASPRPVLPAVASTKRRARPDLPVALGGLDHRAADAVFDRAAGVVVFQLDQQPAKPSVELRSSTSGVLPINSIR